MVLHIVAIVSPGDYEGWDVVRGSFLEWTVSQHTVDVGSCVSMGQMRWSWRSNLSGVVGHRFSW